MATKIPSFTTTCTFETKLENGYWYIYLKSNGTFAFHYSKSQVDIFVCGGGGGGGISGGEWSYGGGGGAGGYQATQYGKTIGTELYDIEIGAGGAVESTGGTTTAFGLSASGGSGGSGQTPGKAGTAAGGTGGGYWGDGQGGGGGEGAQGRQAFGVGDVYYCAGGGGVSGWLGDGNGAGGKTGGGKGGSSARANTGSGGGGDGRGGSGIVILRGTQDDQLPVKFDGVTLQHILYNGEEVAHLIHDGTQIFIRRAAERVRRWLEWSKRKTLSLEPVS